MSSLSANLGDNIGFKNETEFGSGNVDQSEMTGVSGITVVDGSSAKVLFNKIPTENFSTTTVTVCAYVNDNAYIMFIDGGYHGEIIAVQPARGLSGGQTTQFEFNSALNIFQNLSAQGINSVGPELRRLGLLGYV